MDKVATWDKAYTSRPRARLMKRWRDEITKFEIQNLSDRGPKTEISKRLEETYVLQLNITGCY